MTIQEENDFRKVVIDAFSSMEAQNAIVSAMGSKEGQDAIQRGSLAALQSREGKTIFNENFVEAFEDMLLPTLENMNDSLNSVKGDVSRLKESAVKREEFTEAMKKRMLRGSNPS